jgi:uncharacterized membrane protein YhaH (DUF805 family)
MEWMLLPFRRYAEFRGRSRRREYWMFALLNAIIACVLMVVVLAAGLPLGAMSDPGEAATFVSGGLMMLVGLLFLVWWVAVLIPSIAVAVRRLHDRDMSGWWYLGLVVASLIPVVGFLASIALLVLLALPGTPGPNRFGPDPKDPSQAEVFA